jgi:hypothetical protein
VDGGVRGFGEALHSCRLVSSLIGGKQRNLKNGSGEPVCQQFNCYPRSGTSADHRPCQRLEVLLTMEPSQSQAPYRTNAKWDG